MKQLVTLIAAVLVAGCGSAVGTASATPVPSGSVGAVPGSSQGRSAGPVVIGASSVEHAIDAGKPVVLVFMAPGCTSCAAEVAAVTSALEGHAKVQAVGVDLLSSDSATDLRSFLTGANLAMTPLTWTVDASGALAARYNVVNLGETLGLAHGAVRFHNVADADAARLGPQIAGLT